MRTVISFSEGCSGNFLAAFLTNSKIVNAYRIDGANTNLNYSMLPKLADYSEPLKPVIVTHEHDSQKIRAVLNPDQIIRIEPVTGVFTAIYNVFIKKLIDDDKEDILTRWPREPAYCYDRTFEHIKYYYANFVNSRLTSDEIFFDFGWIYDANKMTEFCNKINITGDFNLLEKYKQSQLPLLLNLPDTKDINKIISLIPDNYFVQSPWFACYCLFCFEVNNQLTEDQRLWSINEVPVLGPQQLIELSLKYRQ